MITSYVTDISGWQDWQKEYRYGIILIIPPDPLRERINALRTKYDPIGQAICGAHISLTVPLMRGVEETGWPELQEIAAGNKPVTIHYGPLTSFLPTTTCIYLAIDPKPTLEKILIALESAAVFTGAPPRRFPFVPHMTITEFIGVETSAERAKELTEELKNTAPTGSFLCTGLSYVVPDEDFHFIERGRLEFGG